MTSDRSPSFANPRTASSDNPAASSSPWGWGLLAGLVAVLGFFLAGKSDQGKETWTAIDDGLLKPWIRGQNPATDETSASQPFLRTAADRGRPDRPTPKTDWTTAGDKQGFGPTRHQLPAGGQPSPSPVDVTHPFAGHGQVPTPPIGAGKDPFSTSGQPGSFSEPRQIPAAGHSVEKPRRSAATDTATSLFAEPEPQVPRTSPPGVTPIPAQVEEVDPFAFPSPEPTPASPTQSLSAPPQREDLSLKTPTTFAPLQAEEPQSLELESNTGADGSGPRLIPGEIQTVAGERNGAGQFAEPDPFGGNVPAAMPIEANPVPAAPADSFPSLEPTPFPGGPLTPPDDIQLEPVPTPTPVAPKAPAAAFPETSPFPPANPPSRPHTGTGSKETSREAYSPRPVTGAMSTPRTTPVTEPVNEDVYQVQSGDNYWTISRRFYGTARFFGALAEYNRHRIQDPEKMRPGMYVLVPDIEILHRRYPELTGGGQSGTSPEDLVAGFFVDSEGRPAYRVGKGVTLTDIAQQHLGRATRWVEIYRLNKDHIPDVKTLKIGSVLVLPPDACQVRLAPNE